MNQDQLIIHRDLFQKKIAELEYLLEKARATLAEIETDLSKLEEGEFSGPYTVDNPPEDGQECFFVYFGMHSEIDEEAYEATSTDLVKLSAGLIFPNNPKGRAKAEARLKRGNVQMYLPSEPLTEDPEMGKLLFFVGDTNVFTTTWCKSHYEKSLFDKGRAFEHTPEGILGAFLKLQQIKNETKS